MSRVIKFRLVNKYGEIVSTQILEKNGIIDCPVEWETAEQFTGFVDSKGKEIFEGDKVLIWDTSDCNEDDQTENVDFDKSTGQIMWGSDLLSDYDLTQSEVIGTIHDEVKP